MNSYYSILLPLHHVLNLFWNVLKSRSLLFVCCFLFVWILLQFFIFFLKEFILSWIFWYWKQNCCGKAVGRGMTRKKKKMPGHISVNNLAGSAFSLQKYSSETFLTLVWLWGSFINKTKCRVKMYWASCLNAIFI